MRLQPTPLFEPALTLMAHAHARGPLALEGPWNLSPKTCGQLTQAAGLAPAGGWQALASLMCGSDLMEVTLEGVVVRTPLEQVLPALG